VSIDLKPHRGGWKVLGAPGVEPFFIGKHAKDQALDYAKHRQRSNTRPIRILDLTGAEMESSQPLADNDGLFPGSEPKLKS
jgi:hypothetical protein